MEDFQLRYPIGEFEFKQEIELSKIQENIAFFQHFPTQLNELLQTIPETAYASVYRKGGWNIRQVVHHLADSHANMYIRIKSALVQDGAAIKGYNEVAWATLTDNELPLEISVAMLHGIHQRTAYLYKNLNVKDLQKSYFHEGNQRSYSLLEVLGLYVWHSKHHFEHIKIAFENFIKN